MATTTSRKPSGATTKSGKLPVAAPTNIGKFAVILAMHITKKIMLIDTTTRLAVYLCALTVGSVLTDLFPFPQTFLANKDFFLNRLFVKFGWGWTCIMTGAFIYFTASVYCCSNKSMLRRHLSRMLVGTAWWFTWTSVFDIIERQTGFCTVDLGIEKFDDKYSCREAGGKWIGFDISGHAFLLIYNILIISEEIKAIGGWERIADIVKEEEEKPSGRFGGFELIKLQERYENNTPYVRSLAVALMFLTFIFELMLLGTILYFHNMPQKVSGAVFAVIGWFITYRMWYKTPLSPGEVGIGKFKYMKDAKGKLA